MQRRNIYIGIGIVVGLVLIYTFFGRKSPAITTQTVCCQKSCFQLETATTIQERMQGLMFREQLAKDRGMLFIFPDNAIHAFRMKNTKIPLDMIWLDREYRVVDIQEAKPCKQDPCKIYVPTTKATYVIEVNQGTAKNMGIRSGNMCIPR